jgi:hypothetical protein
MLHAHPSRLIKEVWTMSVSKKCLCLTIMLSMLLWSAAAGAAMIAGDVIVVNFTQTGNTVGGNWNEVQRNSGAYFGGVSDTTLVADLIRLSDGASTGIALDIDAPDATGIGGLNANTGFSASFPQSGSIPNNAKVNLTYHGIQSTFTFSGLNDSLLYNLSFLSAHDNGSNDRNPHDWVIQKGLANEASVSVDPDDNLVYTFLNIATDGSGQITLSSTTTSGGADSQHINAMELVAIPEPASLALVVLGTSLMMSRRRRA